ncbi:MAG: hypothetical protein KBT00_05935 [Bacteroidales bacterium]|nr:hypothetical protein [Candidatus Cacconaster merdequi]
MVIAGKDIHNHLLPGVDDGFHDANESLEAIHRMAENGCRELVFTPHLNPDVAPFVPESELKKVYQSFSATIPAEWGVKTSLAAEYMVVRDFEKRLEHPKSLLTYPDNSILIEMSYYFRSENLENTVFSLVMAGYKPILAHPERYGYMADSIRDFEHLHDMGCRFQLNLMSLGGVYGPASVYILTKLLKNGWYDFAATDLHTIGQLDRILDIKMDRHTRKAFEKCFPDFPEFNKEQTL